MTFKIKTLTNYIKTNGITDRISHIKSNSTNGHQYQETPESDGSGKICIFRFYIFSASYLTVIFPVGSVIFRWAQSNHVSFGTIQESTGVARDQMKNVGMVKTFRDTGHYLGVIVAV